MNEEIIKNKSMISIVIPVYKSTKSLAIIASQVHDLFEKTNYLFELILVNDSPDYVPTNDEFDNLRNKYDNGIKLLQMKVNSGQQFALLSGLSEAKGDFVLTMDDDLQHPVPEILRLAEKLRESKEIDTIFAVPHNHQKKHHIVRNFGSWLVYRIGNLYMDKPKHLISSSFKISRRNVIDYVIHNYNATPNMSTLYLRATKNIINMEVEHRARKFGESNYSSWKLISLAISNVVNYTSLPLAILGGLGILTSIFTVCFISYTLVRKLVYGDNFPGYASTVILISFLGALNLLGIGIIGEYLFRIIKEQQKCN